MNLNDAFFEDGVHIRVAPKTVVPQPIHVLALSVATGQPALVPPRLSLHVGEAAEVTIVESYAGLGPGAALTSAVTTCDLEPGAIVEHVKMQRETETAFHMATMAVWLGRASTFTSHALTFGGRIARNDISAVLDGEGAECTLNGLYVATGDQPRGHAHDDRSRQGALPEPRGLQGHSGGPRPRGVQRQDSGPSGRAEDRRQADQPGAAPERRGAGQHQAAARDLCRRREVHARRGDRSARRGRDVLSARARHR